MTDGETLVVRDSSLFLRYILAVTRQAEDFRTMLRELYGALAEATERYVAEE